MNLEKIEKGYYYHIFNRGINSNTIFKFEENKTYFLNLVEKHLDKKAHIVAYCLMTNHFHLIIKIVENEAVATQALSNLFNAYAKAFNKQQNRTGTLFERPYKRIKIQDENYLKNLILYIHKNPENHKVVKRFEDYKFSSFGCFINLKNSIISKEKDYILNLFENIANFKNAHKSDLSGFENLTGLKKPHKTKTIKNKFFTYIQNLQDQICTGLETVDGIAKFREDLWDRPEGGGGRTRVIENGQVFEKGGVNISGVHGKLPKSMQTYFNVGDVDFFACGLSLVLHPKNPMVPTVHANWRYFEMYDENKNIIDSWFGGGQDLTPYYLFEEDAIHFHKTCKTACDQHNDGFYEKYKKQCDDYFYNAHREEGRGVGGLFFDYCKATSDMSMENWYNFVTEVGNSFLKAYLPIVEKRKDVSFTKAQKNWQEIRRGRYVEFNLVHDKGTLFGLKTNGRIESILMSLPPHVQWVYDHHPESGSDEAKLLEVLKSPREWLKAP